MGKDKGPEPIGDLVGQLLRKYRQASDHKLTKLWDIWESAVGGPIAENTRPAAFKGSILIIYVTSSTWMQQLQFLKKDLIEKVNAALGEDLVEEIKFRIG